MDGLLALDIVIEVLRSTNNNFQPKDTSIQETGATLHSKIKAQKVKTRQKVDQLRDMDYVSTNTHSCQNESQWYILGDTEAMIKMIIKGRSPTMRHVSRTHRVAHDWLFDRINLQPQIQMEYVDTENQLADILTKEWDHFLRLFNILSFSMFSLVAISATFISDDGIGMQSAMSQKGQKTTSNGGSPTAKAKPCLVLREQRSEEISSQSLGSMVNPVNADERKEVVEASRQLMQPYSNSEVGFSQTSRQENVP